MVPFDLAFLTNERIGCLTLGAFYTSLYVTGQIACYINFEVLLSITTLLNHELHPLLTCLSCLLTLMIATVKNEKRA